MLIKANGKDIMEEIRIMYDALVNSMDWGSGFLDSEAIDAILTVGIVIGAEISEDFTLPKSVKLPEAKWSLASTYEERMVNYKKYQDAQATWRKQHVAALRAALTDSQCDTESHD